MIYPLKIFTSFCPPPPNHPIITIMPIAQSEVIITISHIVFLLFLVFQYGGANLTIFKIFSDDIMNHLTSLK